MVRGILLPYGYAFIPRRTCMQAAERSMVVTVKHSGSLVTLSGHGFAAKNSVGNAFTAGQWKAAVDDCTDAFTPAQWMAAVEDRMMITDHQILR